MHATPILILDWGEGLAAGAPLPTSRLASGDSITFGTCGCGGCSVDVVVPGPVAVPCRAWAKAYDDHWRLSNLSRAVVVRVSDLEDARQWVTIAPGRDEVSIPFELSRITWGVGGEQEPGIVAFGPEARVVTPLPRCAARGPRLVSGALHAAVLRELTKARLADPEGPLPSSTQISARLAQRGIRLSSRAVDRHVDYLAAKLGMPTDEGRRHVRRELLAAYAAEWQPADTDEPAAG